MRAGGARGRHRARVRGVAGGGFGALLRHLAPTRRLRARRGGEVGGGVLEVGLVAGAVLDRGDGRRNCEGGGARERGAGRGQRAREPRRRRGRSALIRSRRGRVNGFFVGHDAARSSRRAGRFEAGGRTSSSRGGHARVERARSGRVRCVFRRARRVGEARRKRREITNAGEGRTSCRFGGTNRESLHREKINR